ncbi:unnamed protein product [Closterium sp. NIES-54]
MAVRHEPRRMPAQPSLHHGQKGQLLPAHEVDRVKRRYIRMMQYGPTAATISKFTQRACWGVHLGLSHEYRGWLILDINTCKVAPARDILFYEQLTLKQWTEDQIHQVTRAYANNGRSFAYPEDEAAAAALDSDPADDLSES